MGPLQNPYRNPLLKGALEGSLFGHMDPYTKQQGSQANLKPRGLQKAATPPAIVRLSPRFSQGLGLLGIRVLVIYGLGI